MKVRKKPIIIEGEFAKENGKIITLEGEMSYKFGDFIATGPMGEKYPIRRDIFFETYEIIRECPYCGSISTFYNDVSQFQECRECHSEWEALK